MQILEFLNAKLNYASQLLDELILQYDALNDDGRLAKSNIILDNLRSYRRIKYNLLMPYLHAKRDLYEDIIAGDQEIHEMFEFIDEHAIQIHVDEPNHEYYDRMVQLREIVQRADRYDKTRLYPWFEQYLTEEDQQAITSQLDKQMNDETLVSPAD